jgi:hypothetical protein
MSKPLNDRDMKTQVKMRFPNESSFHIVEIFMNEFEPVNEFENEIFGWWKGTYVSISKN